MESFVYVFGVILVWASGVVVRKRDVHKGIATPGDGDLFDDYIMAFFALGVAWPFVLAFLLLFSPYAINDLVVERQSKRRKELGLS